MYESPVLPQLSKKYDFVSQNEKLSHDDDLSQNDVKLPHDNYLTPHNNEKHSLFYHLIFISLL